mgnify:FL=1
MSLCIECQEFFLQTSSHKYQARATGPTPDILTVSEAAVMMNVNSTKYVGKLCSRGVLEGWKQGRELRLSRRSVEVWIMLRPIRNSGEAGLRRILFRLRERLIELIGLEQTQHLIESEET